MQLVESDFSKTNRCSYFRHIAQLLMTKLYCIVSKLSAKRFAELILTVQYYLWGPRSLYEVIEIKVHNTSDSNGRSIR